MTVVAVYLAFNVSRRCYYRWAALAAGAAGW